MHCMTIPVLDCQPAQFVQVAIKDNFDKQFSGRGIIEAKSLESGVGCNVERSRMRRAIH